MVDTYKTVAVYFFLKIKAKDLDLSSATKYLYYAFLWFRKKKSAVTISLQI